MKVPYISWIVVEEKFLRTGVARQLVEQLKRVSKKNHKKFILSSYQNNDPHSRRWHIKMEFKNCGKVGSINEDGSAEVFCILNLY